jgi:hypothetical protein
MVDCGAVIPLTSRDDGYHTMTLEQLAIELSEARFGKGININRTPAERCRAASPGQRPRGLSAKQP